MCLKQIIAITFALACLSRHATSAMYITVSPQTVPGYLGQRLSFSCRADRGQKFWKVNGTFAQFETEEPYRAVIASGWTSWLTVDASIATNNSIVTCWLYYPPNNEESSATILVQGKPGAPSNLAVSVSFDLLEVSWLSPYTLPGTEITFFVNITLNDQAKKFVSTSDQHYTVPLSAFDIDRCHSNHTVQLTVSGTNPAGEGTTSSIITAVIPESCSQNQSQGLETNAPTNLSATISPSDCALNFKWIPHLLSSESTYYKIEMTTSSSNQSFVWISINNFFSVNFSTIGIDNCTNDHDVQMMVYTVPKDPVSEGISSLAIIKTKIFRDENYCECFSPTESVLNYTSRLKPVTQQSSDFIINLEATLSISTFLAISLTLTIVIGIVSGLIKHFKRTMVIFFSITTTKSTKEAEVYSIAV